MKLDEFHSKWERNILSIDIVKPIGWGGEYKICILYSIFPPQL